MIFAILGIIVYVVFFIFIPGFGAISLRRRWMKFRTLIHGYSTVPTLEYDNLIPGEPFSFKGRLESFKDDDIVWLKGESLSICINLNKQDIYTLSKSKDELRKSSWSDISSLMEGTQFFVFGSLMHLKGVPYLVGSEEESLLVVVSDSEENIFEMLLKKGRDKNEMWNSYSPYSYITGVFILIMFSFFSYKTSYIKFTSFFLLLAAGTPFYFILPPGLLLYLRYRRLWDLSVRWSVLSDLKKLRGDFYSSDIYRLNSKRCERKSLVLYLTGYILNIIIAGIILFKVFQLIIFN